MNKKHIMNKEELSEDNDFGLALAERQSIINQGIILIHIYSLPFQLMNSNFNRNLLSITINFNLYKAK